MNYQILKTKTTPANYRVNIEWEYLEGTIESYLNKKLAPLNIDPDFQRGHVWTEAQQIAYLEFKFSGSSGSNEIQLNCPGWMNDFRGPFELVDGKQRLNAVLKFLKNEIKIFGYLRKEIEGRIPSYCEFVFHINNLSNRYDVLKWYIELNSGGTPHTQEELNKVKKLIEKEEKSA